MHQKSTRREFLAKSALVVSASLIAANAVEAASKPRRVIVWSEATVKNDFYLHDINEGIALGLKPLKGWEVLTANITQPDQGLSEELLNSATVLIWWGHQKHGEVKDELVERICNRVRKEGMGFIATHSSHFSKPFQKLVEGSGSWGAYVDDGAKLDVIVSLPRHPIAKGVKNFSSPKTERYSEKFDVPEPEAVVFDGVYTLANGTKEKARQGLCWSRGKGRLFYYQPGHESYDMYLQPENQLIFRNAVLWAAAGSGKKG